MRPGVRFWAWARLAGGLAILVVLVVRLGAGPFVDALRLTNASALLIAAAVAFVTTVCCAWRWTLVARGLGVTLPLRVAVAAYYRSQFLNATLPGGVLGDVHRAVAHGRDAGDLGRSARIVAWERSTGQVVQVALTAGALLLLESPVRSSIPTAAAIVAEIALVLLLVGFVLRGTRGLPSRVVRAVAADVRHVLLDRRLWPGIVLASTVAVAGHVLVFLVAARTAGVPASAGTVLPLALIVLLASAIPMSIAGWGPREGAAVWAFAAAGLGAAQGATVAVVYGVMVLVSTLPGAVVLLTPWLAGTARGADLPVVRRPSAPQAAEGISRG